MPLFITTGFERPRYTVQERNTRDSIGGK